MDIHTHTHTIWRLKAKLIFVAMFMMTLFNVDVGWGQCGNNIIQNANFILGTPCINGNGSSSFEHGCVDSWFRASQTPHHAVENPNSNSDVFCDILNLPPVPAGTQFFPCIGGYEGIFQNLNILPDPLLTFNFSLDVAGLVCEHSNPGNIMEVLVTRDLTPNYSGLSLWNQMTMPKQSLITHTITDNVGQTLDIQFQINPGSNFNQIWIRNTFPEIQLGMFTFDNAILTCTTAALTDIRMNNIAGYTYDLSAINSSTISTFVKHHWTIIDKSNGNIIHSSALASPIYTFPAHGLYQVCLNIEDNNGCCSELFCKDLEIQNVLPICVINSSCIPIGKPNSITLLSQLLAGPNPIIPHQIFFGFTYAVSNVCLSVEGTLVIDVSQVSFNNTTWYMGSGAEIRVNNFTFLGSLTFNNSILEGCTDMWRGINMLTNGVPYYYYGVHNINLTNTTIKDAYRGVELGSGTRITASNSNFINNYVGCYIPPTFTHNQIFTGFGNCTFEFIGGMLPQYNGQPSYNERSYAGIITHDIVRLNVWGNINNSGSLFKNLLYGIRSNKSGLHIENTTFEFTDHDSYSWQVYGVFDENSKYPSGFYGNEFKNVNGIHSRNGTISQQYSIGLENKFNIDVDKGLIGLYVNGGKNISLDVVNNKFNMTGRGISIRINNTIYTNLNIDLNDFNKSDGITLNNVDIFNTAPINPDFVQGKIRNNIFTTSENSTSLIHLVNSPSLVFLKNEINGYNTTLNQNNSGNFFFKNNEINLSSNNTFLNNRMSTENKYCCSYFNLSGIDLNFSLGNTYNSKVVSNELNRFYLSDGSVVGVQPDYGNIFNTSFSQGVVFNHMASIDYYIANRFLVDPMQTGHRPQFSPNFDNWFPTVGQETTCADNDLCDSSFYDLPEEEEEEEWYALVFEDLDESEAQQASENYVLAEKVFQDSMFNFGEVQSWYNQLNFAKNYVLKYPNINWLEKHNGTSYPNISLVSNNIEVLDWAEADRQREKLSSPTLNDLMSWSAFNKERKAKISELHNLIHGESAWTEEMTLLNQEIIQLTQQMEALYVSFDELYNQKAYDFYNMIEQLSSDTDYKSRRKRVWILETLTRMGAIAEVSQEDIEFLYSTMHLCPNEYGKVVMEAYGVLISLGYEAEMPDWDNQCSELEFRTIKEFDSKYNVYPNPTNGLLSINSSGQALKNIWLIDNLGQTVNAYLTKGGHDTSTMDISHLSNGVYYLIIHDENGQITTKKVILLK